MALVFAVVLLQMAVSYSGMLRTAKPQTTLIDERARVEFLANGVIELALLKFQLFPSDFYAACEAANGVPAANRTNDYLSSFVNNNLRIDETVVDSILGSTQYAIQVDEMILHTTASGTRWNRQALEIRASVAFNDASGRPVNRTITRVYEIDRLTNSPSGGTP